MKIKNKIKHLFTKEVFEGENSRSEFFVYNFLSGFLVVTAHVWLSMDGKHIPILDFTALLFLLLGLYLMFINIIRRSNKTSYPFVGPLAVIALIASQFGVNTGFFQLLAITLLVLPNRPILENGKHIK